MFWVDLLRILLPYSIAYFNPSCGIVLPEKDHFMFWIVDGHNLIPFAPGLTLNDPDDEDKLVDWLSEYCRLSGDSIELFFDGAAPGYARLQKKGKITISFISRDKTADQAIIERLGRLARKAPNYTVVSSDRVIQTNARSVRAQIMESPAFASRVSATITAKKTHPADSSRPLKDEEIQWWVDFFNHKTPP
jgi:predicted RNA-binding protein with PIN domain